MSLSNYQEIHLLSLPDYLVLENPVWLSTQSLLKANVAMSNRYLHMLANFLDKWINQMLILLKGYLQLSLLIKNLQIETRALLLEQLQKFMITCVYSLLAPVSHIAHRVAKQSRDRAHNKLLIKFSQCLRRLNFKYWHPLCDRAKVNS